MEEDLGLLRPPSIAQIVIRDNIPTAVVERDLDSKVYMEEFFVLSRRLAGQNDFFNSRAIGRGYVHSITLVLRLY